MANKTIRTLRTERPANAIAGTDLLVTRQGADTEDNVALASDLLTYLTSAQTYTSATLVAPILGTPKSGNLSNCSALPLAGVTGLGTGVATFLATPNSSNLAAALTDEVGDNKLVFSSSPTITSAALTTPTITGGTHTSATALGVNSGVAGYTPQARYVSGRFYSSLPSAGSATTTNTTPLVNDTVYAMLCFAAAPITIKTLTVRTSSSNASNAASVKVGIYAADGANGTPGTLLGSTASGTSITNSATTTDFTITLDTPTPVPAGPYYIAILQTSTTGARFMCLTTSAIPYTVLNGSATAANAMAAAAPIYGYTVAQTYTNGMPSPFGTAVANTTVGLTVHYAIEIN